MFLVSFLMPYCFKIMLLTQFWLMKISCILESYAVMDSLVLWVRTTPISSSNLVSRVRPVTVVKAHHLWSN